MENLPPLPEPSFGLLWRTNSATYHVTRPNIGDTDVFTADQMREYARQAVAAIEQREPVAEIVSSGQHEFPLLEWLSADHSFRLPIGTKLCAYPSPPTSADAVDAERLEVPSDVSYYAKTLKKEGYRGPLHWARTVIDWVASLDAAIAATKEKA